MCLRVVFDKIRLLFVCRGLTSDDVAELRAMRHELCNHLCAISGLAQLNESARISAYVSDLLGALALDSRYTGTGNAAVDAVLTAETKKARERNVLLTVRTMPLPDTNLQDCDLTRLISTLLDTGIRHTEGLLGHKREVGFTLSTENGYLLLSCTYPQHRSYRKHKSTIPRQERIFPQQNNNHGSQCTKHVIILPKQICKQINTQHSHCTNR